MDPVAPATLGTPHETAEICPAVARRGLHLHTLHPIEGLYDLWVPSEAGRARASQIFDWAIKNRANYIQWVALDNIEENPGDLKPWQEHTQALLDDAHARGLDVGVGVQLFGSGNLQLAWDLLDQTGSADAQRATMDTRLGHLTDGLDWDVLSLSFGEFSGEEPEDFIAAVDQAYDAMQAALPGVEVAATIHVGNYEDLRVTYQGEELLYYFLVKYANPEIIPWVHSVMYYNLYEDAGLAYNHDMFDEHHAFLVERLSAGQPAGYHPESAYWVAFDDSVPVYLPLYMRSRVLDLDGLAAEVPGGVQDHVLFSTGWEWGYWQNDVATLRRCWSADAGWEDTVAWMYAPWGADGAALSQAIVDMGEIEHDALIGQRLAPYLAGRAAFIDLGEQVGIVSQPDRVDIDEVQALSADERAAFEAEVVGPLQTLASNLDGVVDAVSGLPPDPWFDEVRDGMQVTAWRAHYAAAMWSAAVTYAAGEDATADVAAAEDALGSAREVVARRHAALHDPEPERLTTAADNPTLYDYGYLRWAGELCYWERELAQLHNLVQDAGETVPGCAL